TTRRRRNGHRCARTFHPHGGPALGGKVGSNGARPVCTGPPNGAASAPRFPNPTPWVADAPQRNALHVMQERNAGDELITKQRLGQYSRGLRRMRFFASRTIILEYSVDDRCGMTGGSADCVVEAMNPTFYILSHECSSTISRSNSCRR